MLFKILLKISPWLFWGGMSMFLALGALANLGIRPPFAEIWFYLAVITPVVGLGLWVVKLTEEVADFFAGIFDNMVQLELDEKEDRR